MKPWMLAILWIAGCSDEPPAPAPGVLVRSTAASAAECPLGGTVISAGLDDNGDAVLDDGEVRSRTAVCNPTAIGAPPVLVRLVVEPPGAHCAAGGTAVESGPDVDHDGALDDAEVTHTDYACGVPLLSRLVAEPPGAHCAVGGVAILTGRDEDGDGVLADVEVEAGLTSYACDGTLARDAVVRSAAELATLRGLRVITGTLTLDGLRGDVALPELQHVGGLVVFDAQLASLSLPQLETVDGELAIWFARIDALDCARLRRVGGLRIDRGTLADLEPFGALERVDHDLQLIQTSLLAAKLPTLALGGELEIISNSRLDHVSGTLLGRAAVVSIIGNDSLTTVDLDVVGHDGAPSELGSASIGGNDQLSHIALSADRMRSVSLTDDWIAELLLRASRIDGPLLLFHNQVPFQLTLDSPGDSIELGDDLAISGPLEALHSRVPVIVDGHTVFDKTLLTALDADAGLSELRGGVRFSDNAHLAAVTPFRLSGTLQLINNTVLTTLSFDAGDELGGMAILDNPALVSVPPLAALRRIRGSADIERNPSLTSLFGPELIQLDGPLFIERNDALTALRLPALERLVSDLIVGANARLETVELPRLIEAEDELFIFDNPALHHLQLDALQHSDFFFVQRNPHLPACEVLAIFAHTSGFHSQTGNDTDASCAPDASGPASRGAR